MQIIVNGQPTSVDEAATVRQMVETLGLGATACAVEVNCEVVPRRQHEARRLAEGDRVEIVTLVGGG